MLTFLKKPSFNFLSTLLAVLCAALLLVSYRSVHAFDLPKFDQADLPEATQVLGFGTSTRFLSNPFPLGGYSGFEAGYTYESIDIEDLYFLSANTTSDEDSLNFSRLVFGKGLFGDVDLFLHFAPFNRDPSINEYGASVKWNFYQAKFIPFSLSFLGHFNTINIQDDYTNESLGTDLIGGINVENFALFFGGGVVAAASKFSKNILNYCTGVNTPANCDPSFGTIGVNDPLTVKHREKDSHSFVGFQFNFANIFLAAQIDRYTQPVYSLKIGYRE
ncbi:MAG: DUF6588 family protein [Bdellovibrionota bacterium]